MLAGMVRTARTLALSNWSRYAGATLGLAAILTMIGCSRQVGSTIPRRVDGELVAGPGVGPEIYERYIEGELAYARGDLAAAHRAFAAAAPERDPFVLARLAEVIAREGDLDHARRLVEDGQRRHPESEALWIARARIAEMADRPDEALDAYGHALRIAPGSAGPVLGAVTLLERRSKRTEALELLAGYVAREPDRSPTAWWRYLVLLVDSSPSEAAVEEAAEALHRLSPRHDEAMRELAARALAEDHPEIALALIGLLPRIREDVPTYLAALAGARGLAEALRQLDRMPDSLVGGPLGRGRCFLELGRPAMAAALAESVAESESDPAAYLLLGRAERTRGQTAAALAALRAVPESAASYVPARIELALALAASGQGARARRLLVELEASEGRSWPEIEEALEALGDAEDEVAEPSADEAQ
jgi:tetratricopeptide (TPR) repeat protein